jgi:hypothetical protein
MSEKSHDMQRRDVLKAAAGLALGQVVLEASCTPKLAASNPAPGASPSAERLSAASPSTASPSAASPTNPGTPAPASPSRAGEHPPGNPGDFNFLAGSWKISHRRRKTPGRDDWDLFEGEATCWTILNGVASIEELRIPARNFSGMGLRLLDVEQRVWNDFWVNGKSGVLTPPGAPGGFVDGVGTFLVDDVDGDKPIKVRGVWDRITATSCRWHQAISRDGGATWEEDWLMDWVRVYTQSHGS